jgi:hypothetical protein
MARRNMKCKWCETMIDYDGDVKKAYLEGTDDVHSCQNIPKGGFPKKWTKKEYKPQGENLQLLAIQSEIDAIKEEQAKQGDAIRALVKEVSFKKGSEVE